MAQVVTLISDQTPEEQQKILELALKGDFEVVAQISAIATQATDDWVTLGEEDDGSDTEPYEVSVVHVILEKRPLAGSYYGA